MVYVPDSDTNGDMSGSLLASHRRSSSNSNEVSVLPSSSTHTLPDDQHSSKSSHLKHNLASASITDIKDSSVSLAHAIEDDDDDGKEPLPSITHSADFFRWTHGHRRVMLTFGTICLFAFMTGVEYAVILPTAFDYVKTMTRIDIYVGLILSAYSISGAITGVIMGKISDSTGKVKILILVSNLFEIGGNVLYFVTNNIHIVLLGRFIAGVGMGAVPPILADVAHRTTEKDRTKAISIILGCRQLGLLIGPCFTLLVGMMDFHIGSVYVNRLNGPGFLMATIWLILQIVCWICFYDRTPSTTTGPSTTSDDSPKHKYTRSDHPSGHDPQKISLKTYSNQYLRIEMIVLFLATFIAYFNQTALETIVAAFTEKHFKWNTVDTSILFAFAGLEIIIVYLSLVFFLSKRFEDRFLLVFGFISLTLACTLGTFFTWAAHSFGLSAQSSSGGTDKRLFLMFIIFVILDLLGLPFLAATSVSLFTKLTIKELQGFSQGVQRFIMGVGTIIGPLFASALLKRLHIMMTTMLGLTLLTLLALFFVLKRLRPLSEKGTSNEVKDANNNRNHSSSIEEESDESALPLSSKNHYVTLVQHDDEQNQYLHKKTSKRPADDPVPLNNVDSQTRSSNSNSHLLNTSSTNVLCLSDEQQRTLQTDGIKPSSQIS